MKTLHHLAGEKLRQIDENLLKLYDQNIAGMAYSVWFIPLPNPTQLGQKAGSEEIEWQEADGEEKVIVKAHGIIFPVLLQELSKGVMEVLTAHGLPENPTELAKVYEYADKLEHEIYHFHTGPALWRKLLKVLPTNPKEKAEAIMFLALLEPDELHTTISRIIDNPEEMKEMLRKNTSENKQAAQKKLATSPAPSAPTKPKTDPKTDPPKREPKRNPFQPPKPSKAPEPKAEEDGIEKKTHLAKLLYRVASDLEKKYNE